MMTPFVSYIDQSTTEKHEDCVLHLATRVRTNDLHRLTVSRVLTALGMAVVAVRLACTPASMELNGCT
jgi:hypothetical protein